MKMLLGLVKPSAGSIFILNKPVVEENRLEILKNTGSLIESPSYYGHLSARENLQIICILKNVPESGIDDVLRVVHLEKQQGKKVKNYSLGMKQRLGLAAALLGHPRLLLLDEPTNGLDPAGIQEMRELICSLPGKYGMTILVSSHLLTEIDQMATHVLAEVKYLLCFSAGEILVILLLGKLFRVTEPVRLLPFMEHFFAISCIGTVLLSFQHLLSLMSDNQILSLCVGLAGSFLGLFSMFLPKAVSIFIVWGYFSLFSVVGINWADVADGADYFDYMEYRSFPITGFLLFLAVGILFYLIEKEIFKRKEV